VPVVTLIANPASGRGLGARLIPRAREAFAREGVLDLRLTARAGDEARLVHAALDDGADVIAVLGGDGTWGKCAAALAASGSAATMAFLRGGTGNDFAKNFHAPSGDFSAMARLCAGAHEVRRVDMGRVDSDGQSDPFLNVAGFGFDVAVLEETMRGGALSGYAVYVAAALRQLLGYRGLDFSVHQLGPSMRRAMMLVVSNGSNFGGAFRIAPDAKPDDGLLDLIDIGDLRGLSRLLLFLRVIRGTHLTHPRVAGARAAAFDLRFAEPPGYECDGELHRARSAEVTVRCVRGAIRVMAGAAPGATPGSAGTPASAGAARGASSKGPVP
jgi:diacylglycerol kinase (ATP)